MRAHHHHIDPRKRLAVATKTLADNSLEPVSVDRPPGALFGNGKTEAGVCLIVGAV